MISRNCTSTSHLKVEHTRELAAPITFFPAGFAKTNTGIIIKGFRINFTYMNLIDMSFTNNPCTTEVLHPIGKCNFHGCMLNTSPYLYQSLNLEVSK